MIDSTWLLFQRTQVGWLTRVCNPSSWVSDTIFWFPWALYECSTQTYIQINTHTHKIINKIPLPKKEKRKEMKEVGGWLHSGRLSTRVPGMGTGLGA